MRNYKYFRVHTGENAYSTQLPRGIFVAVWRLVDNKVMTSEEINIYWENREWFEENLPIPPFYTNNNPDKAITWFKTTDEAIEMFSKMTHYINMAQKYNVKLYITKTNDIPGVIIYEDIYQIAVKESKHSGEGYITSEFDTLNI
jgi:hypothetical protein